MSSHKNWFDRISGEKFTHPIPKNPSEIYGFCNFFNIYESAVLNAPNNAVFIEIGTMAGLSTALMTSLISSSKKNITFYSIDPLPDLYGDDSLGMYGQDFDVPMYKLFIRNLKSLDLLKYVIQLRMTSYDAVDLFKNESVDFVFIDGDHSTDAVIKDITDWLPKLKKDGVLAGHDYDHPTVKAGVHSVLNRITLDGTSWIHDKKQVENNINTIQFSNLD